MKRKQCFTLVEILAVVAITGILITGTAMGVNALILLIALLLILNAHFDQPATEK